jgi:hypothetical protein
MCFHTQLCLGAVSQGMTHWRNVGLSPFRRGKAVLSFSSNPDRRRDDGSKRKSDLAFGTLRPQCKHLAVTSYLLRWPLCHLAAKSMLSSRGPSQGKVSEAMNTNSPTDVSWWGCANFLIYASIFFPLLMQAIEVEEHFHVQHAYATLLFQKERD